MPEPDILRTLNVTVTGAGEPTLVLAHGFGSDQTAWRHQVEALAGQHRIVLFDHLGCGGADRDAYHPRRYNSYERYADDLLRVFAALGVARAVLVGHSASAMIGMLASQERPDLFAGLVMLAGSPRYLDDGEYRGGFTQADLDSLYETMASSYLGWANGFAPLAMRNGDRPELAREFAGTLTAMRPDIAQTIARVLFESDYRSRLAQTSVPTLILQSQNDIVVPPAIGPYMAEQIPGSQLRVLDADGHLPHLSDHAEVTEAVRSFAAGLR